MLLEKESFNYSLEDIDLDYCITKIANNDKTYFEKLYVYTAKNVYSYALSMLKSRHDAEDVLQNVYVKIYHAASSYQPNKKAMAWILTITKHECFEVIRKRQYATNDIEEDWNNVVEENDDLSITDKLLIQKCMTVLSDEEREIVILHAVVGLKHREIAKMLNLLLPTVLSKYNRAIKKLKDEYLKEIEHEK